MKLPHPTTAVLICADGSVFYGFGIGARGTTIGEICFNTSMTGYQEVLTDSSYYGQIITFTFPHIGNVGCNGEDIEARGQGPEVSKKGILNPESRIPNPLGANGLIIREPISSPSNFRSQHSLPEWLEKRGITGICGVDTRAITRHIRTHGAQNVLIAFPEAGANVDVDALKQQLAAAPNMKGLELTQHVTSAKPYDWKQQRWSLENGYSDARDTKHHVVAIDFGEKLNILRCLASFGCKVTVVPSQTSADEILALKPDGVFLSNGPGDPAATGVFAVPTIQALIAKNIPVFGICLGHQLLGIALGGKTEKMKQGHRGANHPVKDLTTGKVEITSQNHGFAVIEDSLPANVEVTHRSLFDGSVEGIALKGKPVFSVQHHPESSPGPHDSMYLFERFVEKMRKHA